jgi:hypothetical protein
LGSEQWALGSEQWALGSGCWAVSSGRWALGSEEWAMGKVPKTYACKTGCEHASDRVFEIDNHWTDFYKTI